MDKLEIAKPEKIEKQLSLMSGDEIAYIYRAKGERLADTTAAWEFEKEHYKGLISNYMNEVEGTVADKEAVALNHPSVISSRITIKELRKDMIVNQMHLKSIDIFMNKFQSDNKREIAEMNLR